MLLLILSGFFHISDDDEFTLGTNPGNSDTDGDGLGDGVEITLGTNPSNADTDGDGVGDGDEVANCTDPLVPDAGGSGGSSSGGCEGSGGS